MLVLNSPDFIRNLPCHNHCGGVLAPQIVNLFRFLRISERAVNKVINEQRVINSWDEIMWFAGSLVTGHVTASLMIQKLQAYPRKHPLYLALQEYGKLMSTIQTLRWYEDIHTLKRVSRQLNKTEAIHSLRSHVFFAHQGKVKGKPDEQLKNQVGCLNLVSNIIIGN